MALQYMAEQRSILRAAMHDLLQRVTDLLHHASKYITDRAQQQPRGKVCTFSASKIGDCLVTVFVLQPAVDATCGRQICGRTI